MPLNNSSMISEKESDFQLMSNQIDLLKNTMDIMSDIDTKEYILEAILDLVEKAHQISVEIQIDRYNSLIHL